MKKMRGIWIDHREARVVTLGQPEPGYQTILSNVEKRVRASGGVRTSTPFGPQDVFPEDQVQRKFELHLARFYEEVLTAIAESAEIFIMGPGDAKLELRKHLGKAGVTARIPVAVEAADKLTKRQVIARVRSHFGVRSSAAKG